MEIKKYDSDDFKIIYNENTKILQYKVDEIEPNSNYQFVVCMMAKNFEEGKYEYNIPINAYVYLEDTNEKYRADNEEVTAYSSFNNYVKSYRRTTITK